MFSKQEPKLSLKPVGLKNSGQDDKISLGSREQDSIKSGKTLSMDKNEHRFRFLMDNLGQWKSSTYCHDINPLNYVIN